MATAPIYCTHKELKRVFPQLDEYDQKTPVYGWTTTSLAIVGGAIITSYVAYNTGLMNNLFIDGASKQSGYQKIGTSSKTLINSGLGYIAASTTMTVDSTSLLVEGTYIKIGDEILGVTDKASGTSMVVTRGEFGTTAADIENDAPVYFHFQPSAVGDNLYDEDNDFIVLKHGSDPNDALTEVGENFNDIVIQFRTDASRYLDSRLDPTLPKSQWKNTKGEFDYIIVRTTALIATAFMIRTNNPTSEVLESIELEYEKNIELLNTGKASLGYQNTGDASEGVIREVSATTSRLHPVDLKGRASGVDFDLIKVVITKAGAIGLCQYSVWVKNSDGLKNNLVVDGQLIIGDYQPLAYGLQVRFGDTDLNEEAVINDEWEVEVRGYNEKVDASDLTGISMTRRRGV